jgi:hypothetical protein
MKTNEKIQQLIKYGINFNILKKLNENKINLFYSKLIEQVTQAPQKQTVKVNVGPKGGPIDLGGGKKATFTPDQKGGFNVEIGEDVDYDNSLSDISLQDLTKQEFPHDSTDMAPDGMDDDSDNNRKMMSDSEIKEKSVSKQQQKLMGLALSVKKGKTPKSDVSKKIQNVSKSMTKKQLEDFAKTPHKNLPKKIQNNEQVMSGYFEALANHSKGNLKKQVANFQPQVKFGENLERQISKLVEKHIPAKMSKKELLYILENWEEDDDVIVKPNRPITKPAPTIDPDDPYQPAPDVEPVPRAGEEDDDVIVKPKRPTTKPVPTIDPDDPYQPAPDVEPVPRANKDKLPKWLSFDELKLQFKK